MALTIGLAIAAVAVGGWRMVVPGTDATTQAASDSVAAVVGDVTAAFFTSAEASLAVQKSETGSYAGAPVEPPVRLVWADESSYCIELDRPPLLQHRNGPGGAPAPGSC
jgi:hypothetical protein